MNKSQNNDILAFCKPSLLVCVWRSTGADGTPLVCDWVTAGGTAREMNRDEDDSDRTEGYYGSPARGTLAFIWIYHRPLAYTREKTCSKLTRIKQKLGSRIKRIRGQADSIERSLTTCADCADVLMLLANLCGVIVPADGQVISSLCMSAIVRYFLY